MANVFLEPSTRTASSFNAAFCRLGGKVITIQEGTSSTKKGETLQDTMRCVQCYSDVLVLRHPETGAAQLAAKYVTKPRTPLSLYHLIHSHQRRRRCWRASLARFTIYNELGHLDNIVVTMVGDLKYGRTVHSLARLLAFYNVRLNYVAPASLQMPESVESELTARGVSQHKTESLTAEILAETDILYMTRIQQERFASQEEYLKYKGVYVIDKALVLSGKPTMRVMHPLPRVGEITEDVDELPQAAFFREMENGMYTRMAIIALVTGTANEVCEMEL